MNTEAKGKELIKEFLLFYRVSKSFGINKTDEEFIDEFIDKKAKENSESYKKESIGKPDSDSNSGLHKHIVTACIRKKCRKPEDYTCIKLHGGGCRYMNCEHWR